MMWVLGMIVSQESQTKTSIADHFRSVWHNKKHNHRYRHETLFAWPQVASDNA